MYPDTIKLKKLYLKEFSKDEKLRNYFEITGEAIENEDFKPKIKFTVIELMEVASKFFYCDKVFPDTNIQSHVCVGLNGIFEAKWENDYKLLEAFCYEGIFDDFDKDISVIDNTYSFEKKEACKSFKSKITSLDLYLLDVRNQLFKRMANNLTLKTQLLDYYERNHSNLAFIIEK